MVLLSSGLQPLARRGRAGAVAVVLAAVAAGTGPAQAQDAGCQVVSPADRLKPATGRSFMVAAANPLAAKAGCAVLKRGGTAIDAAIAVQAVLAVVEPQASGLVGGTLITYWDNDKKRVRYFEGLSRAPKASGKGLRTPVGDDAQRCGAKPDRLMPTTVNFTARAVGVPGTLRVLELAHKSLGKERWNTLFDDGIRLARSGFPLPKYLHTLLGEEAKPGGVGKGLKRCRYPNLMARFCIDRDTPKAIGTPVRNPELAAVLELVRDGGAAALYEAKGKIVQGILARLAETSCKLSIKDGAPAVMAGLVTGEDFERYEARERKPVCRVAFNHVVCSASPPSFGGGAVLSILKLADVAGIAKHTPDSLAHAHIMIESSRLTQADRRQYVGDPDHKQPPMDGLLASAYLAERARLIKLDQAVPTIQPGALPTRGLRPVEMNDPTAATLQDQTSHVTIVDRYGNALAMTTTNNSSFGAQMEALGMVLNNVLVNFTRAGSISLGYDVNAMRPFGRPRTAMAPTIVFNRNMKLRLVVGAAGGGAIPDYVANTILRVLVFGMDPQTAINQPHVSGQNVISKCDGKPGYVSEVEQGTPLAAYVAQLKEMGHPCARAVRLRSGLTAIAISPDGRLHGAADPRRDGVAVGE